MTMPKLLAGIAIFLLSVIGIAALFKGDPQKEQSNEIADLQAPLEVDLDQEMQVIEPATEKKQNLVSEELKPEINEEESLSKESSLAFSTPSIDTPNVDRIQEFFNIEEPKLPIVETITYKSHVSWQKGRPAWLSDYAAHYKTSKHFIARSLNGKPDYLKQELKENDRFNVLNPNKNFHFDLVLDTSKAKLLFYYKDEDTKEKVLVKTYKVSIGRIDPSKESGLLTPLGKYTLGDKIAIYKPKVQGTYQGQKTEMITVFGTRWIPFEKEIGKCTAPAKGYGIHGTPWNKINGQLTDQTDTMGKYESDGCIRLATPDMEELFSIIISRPTTIEIVRDFSEANLEDVP